MISYELAEKLKEAGFPMVLSDTDILYKQTKCPTLSELIEACGDGFGSLERCEEYEYLEGKLKNQKIVWIVESTKTLRDKYPGSFKEMILDTPEEAVANLWLKLNEKK